MSFQKTGYIPVKDGYCDYRAVENGYYLTACGKLVKYKPAINGKCTECGKPMFRELPTLDNPPQVR